MKLDGRGMIQKRRTIVITNHGEQYMQKFKTTPFTNGPADYVNYSTHSCTMKYSRCQKSQSDQNSETT